MEITHGHSMAKLAAFLHIKKFMEIIIMYSIKICYQSRNNEDKKIFIVTFK